MKCLPWSEAQFNLLADKSKLRKNALMYARMRLVEDIDVKDIVKEKNVSRTLVQRAIKNAEDWMDEYLSQHGLEWQRIIVSKKK